MKIKELIEILQKFDQDRIVILSSDSEGNMFSPLADLNTCAYVADHSYEGRVSIETLTPELISHGYSEFDLFDADEKPVPAIVMYPTT